MSDINEDEDIITDKSSIFDKLLIEEIAVAYNDYTTIINRILNIDSNIFKFKDSSKNNLLMRACEDNNPKLFSAILESPFINISILKEVNSNKQNILLYACLDSHICALILLEKFPHLIDEELFNGMDIDGDNILSIIFRSNQVVNVTTNLITAICTNSLFNNKILNSIDCNKSTPLMLACQNIQVSSEAILNLLSFYDITNINFVDVDGISAIMHAAQFHPAIVKRIQMITNKHTYVTKNIEIDSTPVVIQQFLNKQYIKSPNSGFSYLHILAIYNPSFIRSTIINAHIDDINIKDHYDRYFYDYLNDVHKRELNNMNLNNIIPKFVLFANVNSSDIDKYDCVVCKICYDKSVDTLLLPCKHTTCNICCKSLKECHVCKASIAKTCNIYLN